MYSSGIFYIDDGITRPQKYQFFVMKKYEITLANYLVSIGNDPIEIFDIGAQLIDILKIVHSGGYTYNDMKPENIMISQVHDS